MTKRVSTSNFITFPIALPGRIWAVRVPWAAASMVVKFVIFMVTTTVIILFDELTS